VDIIDGYTKKMAMKQINKDAKETLNRQLFEKQTAKILELEQALKQRENEQRRLAIAENNLKYLSEVSKILASSLEYKTTLANVAKLAVPQIADWCTVAIKNGDELEELATAHIDPAKVAWAKKIREKDPLDPNAKNGIAKVIRTAKPELIPYITDEILVAGARDEAQLSLLRKMNISSIMIVPLIHNKKALGAITFLATESGRHYAKSDISVAEEVASRMALAIENSRLYTEAKNADRRQEFLAEAAETLGATIDYKATLKNLGNMIVPFLADYCRIVVVDDHKKIKEITVNHIDPSMLAIVNDLYDSYKDIAHSDSGVGGLLTSGKSQLMTRLTPKIMSTTTPKIKKIITTLNLQSYMGVPMKINKNVVGAITFSSTNKDRIYKKEDLQLAEELARRAALAIQNARLYDESQRAIMLRDEFISVASHELKTPVTSLKIYGQALHHRFAERGHADLSKYFIKMDDQINKLNKLISDLLDVSKIEHGRLEFAMSKFSLQDVVREAVEALQTANGHKLLIEGTLKRKVFGDRYRVYQVVTNLLTNAIKYSPKADKVIIKLGESSHGTSVTVQDFGIGIDKKHNEKLFDKFYRVSTSHGTTYPGLGIGLFIVKQIIQRHDGELKVISEKGKGSQFTFTLPRVGSIAV
jgi:signal transduction histidine kinase